MRPIDLILSKLPDAKKRGKSWEAKCPAHQDRTASLSITQGNNGDVLLYCHAKCETKSVMAAMGLGMKDLFSQQKKRGTIVDAYDYRDESGKLLYQVVRTSVKSFPQRRPNGANGWIWKRLPVELVLYRLPELLSSNTSDWVFVAEGEKSTNAVVGLGLVATTNTGGAGKWLNGGTKHIDPLKGRKVCVLADNDPQGKDHAEQVADSLCGLTASLRVLNLPGLKHKQDVYDWCAAGGTKDDLLALTKSAPEYKKLSFEDLLDITIKAENKDYGDALRRVFEFIAKTTDPFDAAKMRKATLERLNMGKREYKRLLEAVNKGKAKPNKERYTEDKGCICDVSWDDEGNRIALPLCNFTAEITRDISRDNGEDVSRDFAITGKLATGARLGITNVPAGKFAKMQWVTKDWGAKAVIHAGWANKDKAREAIQVLSTKIETKYVFEHTGWRVIGGKRVYLTANNTDDVSVELPTELKHYSLPADPQDAVGAMKASLRFLDVAPLTVTVPLWAATYLAPLTEIVYPGFVVWLFGTTGTFKTTLSALNLSHYGPGFTDTTVPVDWHSTINSIEKVCFLAKDTIVVVDDFRPVSDPYRRRELETKARRLVRLVGNQKGRTRMNADLSLRTTYLPRGLVISTGEQLPGGRSVSARMLAVEMCMGDVDLSKLTAAQAESHRYSHAMAGYLQQIAGQWDDLVRTLPKLKTDLRQQLFTTDQHARVPNSIATLYVGFEMAVQYAMNIGALSQVGGEELRERGWEALRELAGAQADLVEQEKPSTRFLSILADLLCQHKVALVKTDDKDGGIGGNIGKPDHAERLGWYDAEHVYLLPGATFNKVCKFCRDEGQHFPVNENALRKELLEEGLLITVDDRRTTRLWDGEKHHRVLKLRRENLKRFAMTDFPEWFYSED